MLELALIFLCLSMIVHFSNHWFHVTTYLLEERRYERMKSTINWKTLERNPDLGSTARGSALGRA